MCDGGVFSVPIILAVVGAATAVYGMEQQKKSTEQMAQVQQDEIDATAQQKTQERMEEARSLRASARAGAAEGGVSGNSVSLLLDDVMGQAGRDAALIESNRKSGISASMAEADARNRSATSEAFRDVANSGVSAYSDYSRHRIT